MQQQTTVSRQPALTTRNLDAKTPLGWRHVLWLTLLVAASVAFSFGFACAVPFAAFAAAGVLTLTRRDAVLLCGAVWLANQLVGFAWLGYPWTTHCVAWGAALGVVAVLAAIAAQAIAGRLDGRGRVVVSSAAFIGAFIVYEGGLFVIAATLLGGAEDYTVAIVTRILEINAAAFIGLLVVNRLATVAGLVARPAFLFPLGGRHA